MQWQTFNFMLICQNEIVVYVGTNIKNKYNNKQKSNI